jgi:hypothetical protein
MTCYLRRLIELFLPKVIGKKLIFYWHHENPWRKQRDPDPDQLISSKCKSIRYGTVRKRKNFLFNPRQNAVQCILQIIIKKITRSVPERSVAKYLILRLADWPRQAAAVSSLLGPVSTYRVSSGKLSIICNVDKMPYVLLSGRTDLGS